MKRNVITPVVAAVLAGMLMIPVSATDKPMGRGIYFVGDVAADCAVSVCDANRGEIAPQGGFDCDGDGNEDAFYQDAERYTVSYTGAVEPGANYLVMLYTGDSISADSILYLDQIKATDSGALNFDVYPREITQGTIKITSDASNFEGAITVAEIQYYEAYTLGDVDENGTVNTLDTVEVLQYIVEAEELTTAQKLAADVDRTSVVDVVDGVAILQYVISDLPFDT